MLLCILARAHEASASDRFSGWAPSSLLCQRFTHFRACDSSVYTIDTEQQFRRKTVLGINQNRLNGPRLFQRETTYLFNPRVHGDVRFMLKRVYRGNAPGTLHLHAAFF